MKRILWLVIFMGSFAAYGQHVRCVIVTGLGNIEIELYPRRAPSTVSNFLYYVDRKLYDSTTFFRVCTPQNEKGRSVQIEVVQGGDVAENSLQPPITLETTRITGVKHKNGVLSMARSEANTATSSFFICVGNQPELDFGGRRHRDRLGFAAFGKVLTGMRVVKKIQKLKEKDQYLEDPVRIISIRRS